MNMMKLLTPELFYIGEQITVEVNGKEYSRKVYDRKGCDLFFWFKNKQYYKMEFIENDNVIEIY